MQGKTNLACRRCGAGFSGYSSRTKFCSERCLIYGNVVFPTDPTKCWEWQGSRDPGGYGWAKIQGEAMMAHVRAYRLFCGPVPTGLVVRHKCHNRACVNPAHLRLGTYQDNSNDMIEAGHSTRGERNPSARLTAAQVLAIRRDQRRTGVIARAYGVAPNTISSIRCGKNWSWLEDDAEAA